ncbi:MAG TPA: mechanosensitive ion channel [Candidatus Cryptobacteroides intestinipullorum]|nr:mechanosensitive ion channel [Candidatus Cryptobacteroides intestinipullorum]
MIADFLQTSLPEVKDTVNIQKATAEFIETLATTPADQLISQFAEKAIAFGLKVLAALAIYLIGAWLIRKIKKIIHGIFIRRNTEHAIASFVESITSITLTVFLVIITISALGVNTTSIAALLAAGGMAIGMALSGTVQNFAGGIMLMVFKPFKSGDFIEAQGYSGTVSDVSIVSTKIITTDNRNIIIPNGALSNGTINNYSQNVYRRLEWLVDVEYGASSEQVKAILKSIVADEKRIVYKPDAPDNPMIALNALRDSSVQFIIRAWVRKEDYWPVLYDVNEVIYNKIPENGIQFPFPQMDVHLDKTAN